MKPQITFTFRLVRCLSNQFCRKSNNGSQNDLKKYFTSQSTQYNSHKNKKIRTKKSLTKLPYSTIYRPYQPLKYVSSGLKK